MNKMKNKKYHTMGTVRKSNRKIVETETKLTPITHIYMTIHFPGLAKALQFKVGKTSFMGSNLLS